MAGRLPGHGRFLASDDEGRDGSRGRGSSSFVRRRPVRRGLVPWDVGDQHAIERIMCPAHRARLAEPLWRWRIVLQPSIVRLEIRNRGIPLQFDTASSNRSCSSSRFAGETYTRARARARRAARGWPCCNQINVLVSSRITAAAGDRGTRGFQRASSTSIRRPQRRDPRCRWSCVLRAEVANSPARPAAGTACLAVRWPPGHRVRPCQAPRRGAAAAESSWGVSHVHGTLETVRLIPFPPLVNHYERSTAATVDLGEKKASADGDATSFLAACRAYQFLEVLRTNPYWRTEEKAVFAATLRFACN